MNSCGLFLLYVATCAGVSRCCAFLGFVIPFVFFFFLFIQIPLLISVVSYHLWFRVVCSSFRWVFFYPWLLFLFYVQEYKGWILYSLWGGYWSWGIVRCLYVCGRYLWWFGHLRFFIRMSKNGSSLEPCSIVNCILGCRFCSRLCNSLMSPQGHFQNIKQSSKYLFHDFVNSPFMLLPYFFTYYFA